MKSKLFALLIVVLILNVTLVAALPWWLEWFVKPFTQSQPITGQPVSVIICPGGKQPGDSCYVPGVGPGKYDPSCVCVADDITGLCNPQCIGNPYGSCTLASGVQGKCDSLGCTCGGTTVAPGCSQNSPIACSGKSTGTACTATDLYGNNVVGKCYVKVFQSSGWQPDETAISGDCLCFPPKITPCGNGQYDFGEQCDPGTTTSPTDDKFFTSAATYDYGVKCEIVPGDILYTGGTLKCNQKGTPNECKFDLSACYYCGNGVCNSPEETATTCPQDCGKCGDGIVGQNSAGTLELCDPGTKGVSSANMGFCPTTTFPQISFLSSPSIYYCGQNCVCLTKNTYCNDGSYGAKLVVGSTTYTFNKEQAPTPAPPAGYYFNTFQTNDYSNMCYKCKTTKDEWVGNQHVQEYAVESYACQVSQCGNGALEGTESCDNGFSTSYTKQANGNCDYTTQYCNNSCACATKNSCEERTDGATLKLTSPQQTRDYNDKTKYTEDPYLVMSYNSNDVSTICYDCYAGTGTLIGVPSSGAIHINPFLSVESVQCPTAGEGWCGDGVFQGQPSGPEMCELKQGSTTGTINYISNLCPTNTICGYQKPGTTGAARCLCQPLECQDGIISSGETCDPGNPTAGIPAATPSCPTGQQCTSSCACQPITTQVCGNNKKEGIEECDGTDSNICGQKSTTGKAWTCAKSGETNECTCREKLICGDGITGNPTTGSPINENNQAEVCDIGKGAQDTCGSGYRCSGCICIPITGTYCGDGTIQSPNSQGQQEKCEPNTSKNTWSCGDKEPIACETKDCSCIYCGDGKDSLSKQCDIDPHASQTQGQPIPLAFNSCTGGQICGWQAKSQGQDISGNNLCGCVTPTITTICGDGQVTGGEVCDPGDGTLSKPPKGCPINSFCNPQCNACIPKEGLTTTCGDGKVQQPNTAGFWEQCDEDQTTKIVDWGGSQEQAGYTRSCKACQVVYDPICGNGLLDEGEKCDLKIGTTMTIGDWFVGKCSAEEVCGWDIQGKKDAEKCQCYPKPLKCGDELISKEIGEQCEVINGVQDISNCPTATGQEKYVCGYDTSTQKNCQCIKISSACNRKYNAIEDEGKCDGATQDEANKYCSSNSACDLNTCNCVPVDQLDYCAESEQTVIRNNQQIKTKITTLRKLGGEFVYADGTPPPSGAPEIKTHIGETPSTFSEMCYQCKTSERQITGGVQAGTIAEVVSYYCPIEIKESFCGNGVKDSGEQCDPGEKDINKEVNINKKLGSLGNDYCKGCLRYLCYPTQIDGKAGVLHQNYGGEQLFLPNQETPSLRNQQTGELEQVKLSDLTTKLPFTNLNDFELTQTTSSTKKPLSSTCWKCAPLEEETALQLLLGSKIQPIQTPIAQQLEHLVPQPTDCEGIPPPPPMCILNNIKESSEKCDFGKPETRQLPSGSETCTGDCEYSKCEEINGGVNYQNFNEDQPSIWQNEKIPEGLIDPLKGKVEALANHLRGSERKSLSPTTMPSMENSCWKCDYPEVSAVALTVGTLPTTSKVPILKHGAECAAEKKLRCCVVMKTTTPDGRPISGIGIIDKAVINPSQVEYKTNQQGILITPRLTTEACNPPEIEAVDENGNPDLTVCTPKCTGCSQIPQDAIHPNIVPHKTLLKSDPEDIEGPPLTTPPEKGCPKKPNPTTAQEICPVENTSGLSIVTAGDKMSLECVRTGKGSRWDYESCKCVTDPSPEEPAATTCTLYETEEKEPEEISVEPSKKPSTNIISDAINTINNAPEAQPTSRIGEDGKPLTGITGRAVTELPQPDIIQRINNADGTLTLVYSDKSQKVITFYPVKDEKGEIATDSFISRIITPEGKSTKREKLLGNKIKETYPDGTSVIYETLPDDTARTLSYQDPANNYIENYEYLEDKTRRVTNNLGGGYKLQQEYTDQESKTTYRNLEEVDKFGRKFKYAYTTKEINGQQREITIILDENNEILESSYKEGFKPFTLECAKENNDYKCSPPEPEQYQAKQNDDESITYTKKEGEPYWYKCKPTYIKDPSNVFGGQKKTCLMLESQGRFNEKTNTFDTQIHEYDSKTGTTKITSASNPTDVTINYQILNEDGTVESITLMATTDSGQKYYPKKQSDGTLLYEFEDGTKQLLSQPKCPENKTDCDEDKKVREITAFWSDMGEKTEVLGKNLAGQTEYKVISKDGSLTYYKEDGKNADGTTRYFTTKTVTKEGEETIREKTSQGFKEITIVEKDGKKIKRETHYTYDESGKALPQNYKDEDGQTGDFVGGKQKIIEQKCGDKKEDNCLYELVNDDYQLKKIERKDGTYEAYTYSKYQGLPLTKVQRSDGTYFVMLEAEDKKQETIEFFDGENHICTARLKDNTYVQSILSNKKNSLSQYTNLDPETTEKLISLGIIEIKKAEKESLDEEKEINTLEQLKKIEEKKLKPSGEQFTLRFKNDKDEVFKQTPLENGFMKLEPDESFKFFNEEMYAHPAYYSYVKENCYYTQTQQDIKYQQFAESYIESQKPKEKPEITASGTNPDLCVGNAINKASESKAKLPEPKLIYQITDPKNDNRVVREAIIEEVEGEQAIYDYVYKTDKQYLRINTKEKTWVAYKENKPTAQLMRLQTANLKPRAASQLLTGQPTLQISERFDYQLATFSDEDSQVFKCKEYKTEKYNQPLSSGIDTSPWPECEKNPELCAPSKCPDENSPVCGRDGVTYKNICELKLAGAKLLHEGACEVICQTNDDCNSQSACADGTQYYPKICIEKTREIENEDGTTENLKYKTCAVNPEAALICLRAKCPPVSASNTCPQDTLPRETFNNEGCFTGYQCINANGGITQPSPRACPTLDAPTPPVGYQSKPNLDANNCVVSYDLIPLGYTPEEQPGLEKPLGEINCDQVSVCNDGKVIKPYIKVNDQCVINPAEKCEESLLTYNSEIVDYRDEDIDGRVDIDGDNLEDAALIKKISESRAEVVRIPFGSKDNDHDNDAIPDWLDIDKYNTGVMFTKPTYSTQEVPEDRDQDNNKDVMEMLLAGPLYAEGQGYNFENDQLNNLVSDKERNAFTSIGHALTSYAELIPGYVILKLPYTLTSSLRWSAPSITGLVFFPAGPDSAFPSPVVEKLKIEKKAKPLGYVDYLNKAYFNANKIIANHDQLRDYVENHLNTILAKLASVNNKLKSCQNLDFNQLKAEIDENAKKISSDAQRLLDDSHGETEKVRSFLEDEIELAWMALNGYDYWKKYVEDLKNAGQNYKDAKQKLDSAEKIKSKAEDATRKALNKLKDGLDDYLSKMPPERAEKAREAITQFLDEFNGLVEDFSADPKNPERGGKYRQDLGKVKADVKMAKTKLDEFRVLSYPTLLAKYGTPEAVNQERQKRINDLNAAENTARQLKDAAKTISNINLDGLQSRLNTLPPEARKAVEGVLNDYGKVMDAYWGAYGQERQLSSLYQTWFGEARVEVESRVQEVPKEQFNEVATRYILRGVLDGRIDLESGAIRTDSQTGQSLDVTQKLMDKIKKMNEKAASGQEITEADKLTNEEIEMIQKGVKEKVEKNDGTLMNSYDEYRKQKEKETDKQIRKELEKAEKERKEKLQAEILEAQGKAEEIKKWDWEARTDNLFNLINGLEQRLDVVKSQRKDYLKLAQKIIAQIQKMGGDLGKAKIMYGLLSVEATKIKNEAQQMIKYIKDKQGDNAPANLPPEERAQKYPLETYKKIKEQLQNYEDELKRASKQGEKDSLQASIKLQQELLKKVYFQLAHNYMVANTYYHKAFIDLSTMQSIVASMFLLKSFNCQLDAQLQGTHLTQPQEGGQGLPLVGQAINACLTGPLEQTFSTDGSSSVVSGSSSTTNYQPQTTSPISGALALSLTGLPTADAEPEKGKSGLSGEEIARLKNGEVKFSDEQLSALKSGRAVKLSDEQIEAIRAVAEKSGKPFEIQVEERRSTSPDSEKTAEEQDKKEQPSGPCKPCTGADGTPQYVEQSLFSQDYKLQASAIGWQVKIPSTRVEPLNPSSRTDHPVIEGDQTARSVGTTSGVPPSIPTIPVKAEIPAEREAPEAIERLEAVKVLCPGKENIRLASVGKDLRAVEACQPVDIQGLTIPQEQLGQAVQNMNNCWQEYNNNYSNEAFDKFRTEKLNDLNNELLQAGIPIKVTDFKDLSNPKFSTALGDQSVSVTNDGRLYSQSGDTGVTIDKVSNAVQDFIDDKFTKPSTTKQDQCDQKSVEYTDIVQKAAKEAGYASVQVGGTAQKPAVFAQTSDGKNVFFTEKGIPVIQGPKGSADYSVLKDGTKVPINEEQNGQVYDVQDGVLVKCAVVPREEYDPAGEKDYLSRARDLETQAQEIINKYGGVVVSSAQELLNEAQRLREKNKYSDADRACLNKAYLENIKQQLIAAGKLEAAANIALQQGLMSSQELASRAGELQREAGEIEDQAKQFQKLCESTNILTRTMETLTQTLTRAALAPSSPCLEAERLRAQATALREQAAQITEEALNAITNSLQEMLELKGVDFKVNLDNIEEALSLAGIKEYDEKFNKDPTYASVKAMLNPLLISKSQNDLGKIDERLQNDSDQLQKDIDNLRDPFYYEDRAKEAKDLLETLTNRLLGGGTLEQQLLGMGYAEGDIDKFVNAFKQIISGYVHLSSASYNYKFGRFADNHRDLTEAMIEYNAERNHLENLQTEFGALLTPTTAETLANRINDIKDRSATDGVRAKAAEDLTNLRRLFDPAHSSEERYAEGVLTYKSETYDLSKEQRTTLTQQINPTVEKIKRIREKAERGEPLDPSKDYISPEESKLVLLAAEMLGKGKDTHYKGVDGQYIKGADYGEFLDGMKQRDDLKTALSYVISHTAMMEWDAQSRGDMQGATEWSARRKQAEELSEYNNAVLQVLNIEDNIPANTRTQEGESALSSLGGAMHKANLAMLTMGQNEEQKAQTRVDYFNRLNNEWTNAQSAESEQREARGGLAWGFATSIVDMLTGNMPGSTVKGHSRAAESERINKLTSMGGWNSISDEIAENDPDTFKQQVIPTLLENAESLVRFIGKFKRLGVDVAAEEQQDTAYITSILQTAARGAQISAEASARRAIAEDPSIITRRLILDGKDPKDQKQRELYATVLPAEAANEALHSYSKDVSAALAGLGEDSATGGMTHNLLRDLSIGLGNLASQNNKALDKIDSSKLSGRALQAYNNARANAINTLAASLELRATSLDGVLATENTREANYGDVFNWFAGNDVPGLISLDKNNLLTQASNLRSFASTTLQQGNEKSWQNTAVKQSFESSSQNALANLERTSGGEKLTKITDHWISKLLTPREIATQTAGFFVGGMFAKGAVDAFKAMRMGTEAVQAARMANTANRAAQIAGEVAQASRAAQQASRLSKTMWGLADFGVEAAGFEVGMSLGSAATGDTTQLRHLLEHPEQGFINSAGMLGTFKVAGMAFGKVGQKASAEFSRAVAEEGTLAVRTSKKFESVIEAAKRGDYGKFIAKKSDGLRSFLDPANNIATGVQLIGEIGTMMASSRAEEWYSGQESQGLLYNLAQATYTTAMMRGVAGLQHRGQGDIKSRMEADAKKTTRDYLESQAKMRETLEAGEVMGRVEGQLATEGQVRAEAFTQKAQKAQEAAQKHEASAREAKTPEARQQYEEAAQNARTKAQRYDQNSASKLGTERAITEFSEFVKKSYTEKQALDPATVERLNAEARKIFEETAGKSPEQFNAEFANRMEVLGGKEGLSPEVRARLTSEASRAFEQAAKPRAEGRITEKQLARAMESLTKDPSKAREILEELGFEPTEALVKELETQARKSHSNKRKYDLIEAEMNRNKAFREHQEAINEAMREASPEKLQRIVEAEAKYQEAQQKVYEAAARADPSFKSTLTEAAKQAKKNSEQLTQDAEAIKDYRENIGEGKKPAAPESLKKGKTAIEKQLDKLEEQITQDGQVPIELLSVKRQIDAARNEANAKRKLAEARHETDRIASEYGDRVDMTRTPQEMRSRLEEARKKLYESRQEQKQLCAA